MVISTVRPTWLGTWRYWRRWGTATAVAPVSTIDMNILHGDLIEIEERTDEEVTHIRGQRITPEGSSAGNPAFDVTPHHYFTGIITEYGVVYPPFSVNLRQLIDEITAD